MQRHLPESADKNLYRQLQSNHLCLGWWKTAAYNMVHLFHDNRIPLFADGSS